MKKETKIMLGILLPAILFLLFYGIGTIQVNCEPHPFGPDLYCNDAYDMFVLRSSWVAWVIYLFLVSLIEVKILRFEE